ncbi:MAG TPA: ABC transporter permease [Candidatus Angelobacter sp.]|nr:ABC transporter permease [Candidatus Angelobacter sp.]
MRKTFIIARREYLERVRTKSFVVMTLLIPAFMFGITVLPTMMMTRGGGGAKHLVIVASEARTAELIRQQLNQLSQRQGNEPSTAPAMSDRNRPRIGVLTVDVDTNTSEAERAVLTEKVKLKQLDGVIFATQDALAAKKVSFITNDVSSVLTNSEFQRSLNEALHRDLLKSRGMSDQEIDKALEPVSLDPENPAGMGNPEALFFTVFSMVMILYITVLLYGVNVMRAILEEKTSRIMEVMLSTARASEMMAGKILGVAAVGLTQIAIWAAIVLLPSAGMAAGLGVVKGILSVKLLAYFMVFYLLGFALYSTLCAAVGAMVNSEQEAQQLQFVVMLPMIAAVMIMVGVINSPGSPMALWGSLFPLTAPLIMFLRVALQSPPPWQIVLSIALMLVSVYGLVWLCARIYRVGILMYGKKPTLPELMKWIRYA